MRKTMLKWLTAVVVLGAAYAWAYVYLQPQGSDESQIHATILNAANTLSEGSAAEAMSTVSPDYKDSTGLNRERLYLLARRAAYNHRYWSASVRHIATTVRGADASADVSLTIMTTETGQQRDVRLGLVMRREPVHIWGVVPTQRWRVVSVTGIPEEALEISD